MKESRERNQEIKSKRKRDIQLAIDFSKQHLSVSKALQRHEFITWKESRVKKNSTFVENKRTQDLAQRQLVKGYLEKRNLVRMKQAANEKEWIEAKIKEEIKSAQKQSQIRVESLKMLREDTQKKSTVKPNSPTAILLYDFNA